RSPDTGNQVALGEVRPRGAANGSRDWTQEPPLRRAARPQDAEGPRAARARARLRTGARRDPRDPPHRQRSRPAAPRLQREPRHRRGRARDRRRDGDVRGAAARSVGCGAMLGTGDRIPEASVWLAPNDRRTIGELVSTGPALFVFYLFDWSST